MSADWYELMRAHTWNASSSEYAHEWMRLAVHLAESHPDEAAAWISRQAPQRPGLAPMIATSQPREAP